MWGTSGHGEEVQSSQGNRKRLEGFLQPVVCFNLQVGKYELRPLHGELTPCTKAKGGKARRWLAFGGSRAERKKCVDCRQTSEVVVPPEVSGRLHAPGKAMEEPRMCSFGLVY